MGSSIASPANLSITASAGSCFVVASRSWTAANRAARSCAGWIGTSTRAGANRFAPVSPRSAGADGHRHAQFAGPRCRSARGSGRARRRAPVTYASLTLPPSAFATRLSESSEMRRTSKCRRSDRPAMRSECAPSATKPWRLQRTRRRARSRPRARAGCVGCTSALAVPPATLRSAAMLRAVASVSADRNTSTGPRLPSSVTGSAASSGSGGGIRSGSVSSNAIDSLSPPTPSLIV